MANRNNLGCGPLTVKYLVFIFNCLFFLSGLVLIAVGGIAQGFFSKYITFFPERYENPAIGVIVLGGIIMIISFFGCCGAKRENVAMLYVFAGLMVIVLILEFIAAITVAVMRPNIEDLVQKNLNKTMNQYGDPKSLATLAWDDMQKTYHCCGTLNYTDWEGTEYGRNASINGVPDSCCKVSPPTAGCGHNIWTDPAAVERINQTPCYKALTDSARSNLGAIIGGVIGLALLQMVGVWMACCLIKAVKERYEIL